MIRIFPSVFSGTLSAPPSKAHAQRLLYAAALSSSPTTLQNVPACEDIRTTIQCLEVLGAAFERKEKNSLIVQPFIKTKPVPRVRFDFGSCAATARYTLAISAAYGIQADCAASESLKKRTLFPLASRMAVRGATFSGFTFPLTMQGRLEGGEYDFDGQLTSQYVNSILLAAPVLSGPSVIRINPPILMSGQIDITIKTLEQFGISVEIIEEGYRIPGRQTYTSPGAARVHNDWSLAALWLTAGALSQDKGGAVSCTELPADSPQGYRDLTVMHSQLITDFKDITVDASDYPALVPLIAIVAAARCGALHLSGTPQLHHKETDRLKTIAAILRDMGADMRDTEDGLEAKEGDTFDYPEDYLVDCQGDPNLAMSFALAAPVLNKPFLMDEQAVNKTWPGFWDQYRALGGKFDILKNTIDS